MIGANSGLGKETAKYMAKRGAKIIMGCRNLITAAEVKGELNNFFQYFKINFINVAGEIIEETNNHKIVLHHLDLSSFKYIREFATKIIETEPKIDILIHNAGVGSLQKAKTFENIEMTMMVNCYGPFLLTHLLIHVLKKSVPSRIVNVSSKAHKLSVFDPRKPYHLNPIDFWCPIYLYPNSKLAGILLTYELANRLQGSGVTANIVHPGTVDSPIWNKEPFPLNVGGYLISKLFMKTVEQGIQTILYASLSQSIEGVSGKYFRDCKEEKTLERTYDKELQEIMWEEAIKIINLTPEDPQI